MSVPTTEYFTTPQTTIPIATFLYDSTLLPSVPSFIGNELGDGELSGVINVSEPREPAATRGANFPYTTALTLTIAIGCSLLLLNLVALAVCYYRRETNRPNRKGRSGPTSPMYNQDARLDMQRRAGTPIYKPASPSHCGTLRSSTTARSSLGTSCDSDHPHEWPPDYNTCCTHDMICQPPNGTAPLPRGLQIPPPPRSLSAPTHVEAEPLLTPVPFMQDPHQNKPITEMTL